MANFQVKYPEIPGLLASDDDKARAFLACWPNYFPGGVADVLAQAANASRCGGAFTRNEVPNGVAEDLLTAVPSQGSLLGAGESPVGGPLAGPAPFPCPESDRPAWLLLWLDCVTADNLGKLPAGVGGRAVLRRWIDQRTALGGDQKLGRYIFALA